MISDFMVTYSIILKKKCATFKVLPLIVIWDNGIKRIFKNRVSVTSTNKLLRTQNKAINNFKLKYIQNNSHNFCIRFVYEKIPLIKLKQMFDINAARGQK